MRTFIAIDLNEENKAALTKLQDELKQTKADVKWVEPENTHLTLKFLGEISEKQADQIKQVLDKISSDCKPFELSLSDIGAFPELDYPRVIWVGIEKGKKEVEEAAKKIEEELGKLGFANEERPFAAHLTIGRVRSRKNIQALKEVCQLASLPVNKSKPANRPTDELVNSITLYQSKLTPSGPIYTPLHRAALQY